MNQEDANMFKAIEAKGDRLFDLHVADNNRLAQVWDHSTGRN